MSDARHTGGPWEVEPWINGSLAIVAQHHEANDGHIVASLSGPDAAANARLFLASRDLLSALKTAEAHLYAHGKPIDPAITAAIAKATGAAS